MVFARLRSSLLLAAAALALLALSACGEGRPGASGADDTLEIASQPSPAQERRGAAQAFYDQPLTPSTLRDGRMSDLTEAERRVLRDYVNRGIRRDSLETPGTRGSLGGWLDSNLTVGQVIALYQRVEQVQPLPPEEPSPQSPIRTE